MAENMVDPTFDWHQRTFTAHSPILLSRTSLAWPPDKPEKECFSPNFEGSSSTIGVKIATNRVTPMHLFLHVSADYLRLGKYSYMRNKAGCTIAAWEQVIIIRLALQKLSILHKTPTKMKEESALLALTSFIRDDKVFSSRSSLLISTIRSEKTLKMGLEFFRSFTHWLQEIQPTKGCFDPMVLFPPNSRMQNFKSSNFKNSIRSRSFQVSRLRNSWIKRRILK